VALGDDHSTESAVTNATRREPVEQEPGRLSNAQEADMSDKKTAFHSLDQAVGAFAQQKLSGLKAEDLLRELRQQGIGSLEDLVKKTVETVHAGSQRGFNADDDLFHTYCYKFTTYRPHFDPKDVQEFGNFLTKTIG
jgi:hypothetical protein